MDPGTVTKAWEAYPPPVGSGGGRRLAPGVRRVVGERGAECSGVAAVRSGTRQARKAPIRHRAQQGWVTVEGEHWAATPWRGRLGLRAD